MADDNKLEVQIVLDDGSIQKGFVKLEQQADKTAKNTGKSFEENLTGKFKDLGKSLGLVNLTAGLFLAEKAAQVFGAAINSALDQVLSGEKLTKINKQFEVLSQQAGVSAEILRDSFKSAADGLVDDSDLIEVANKALIDLGSNANDLPKLLEIARKSSAVFGGDVVNNFEKINQAVATGQTRQLKSIGILLDAETAYASYAKSIGRATTELTQYEKEQAILNAVLQKGNNQFANIDPSTGKATDAFTRLSVATKNLLEGLQVATSKLLGKPLAEAADSSAAGINRLGDSLNSVFGAGTEQRNARINILKNDLDFLQKKLINPFEGGSFTPKDETFRSIQKLKEELLQLQKINEAVSSKGFGTVVADDARKAESTRGLGNKDKTFDTGISEAAKQALQRIDKENEEQLKKQKEAADKQLEIKRQLSSDIAAEDLKSYTDNVAAAQRKYEQENTQAALDNLINLQKEQEEARFLDEITKINTKYQNLDSENTKLYQQLKENAAVEHEQRLSDIQQKETDRRNKLALKLNEIAQAGINNVISTGLQGLGAQLVKGGNAFAAFGNSILSILGDVAVQMGQLLIAQGLALNSLATSLATFNGAGAIAAGAALIVLGGALKALSGGAGTSTSGGGFAASTGGLESPVGTTPTTNQDTVAARETQTRVQLTINGDVFDSDETGMRIVDLLNESIGKNGSVITERVS